PASQATPLAMVVNELMLNAVEHGLKDRPRGTIRILLEEADDTVSLQVEDDGQGLPADFDVEHHPSSLGLQIVHTLVTDDLKGRLAMESIVDASEAEPVIRGTRAVVTLPRRSARML
ncbi:MAG: ATP-binding protein, partial [Caldilinea sp.]|nr:ATP-binding protein [Caldilinea sp.]